VSHFQPRDTWRVAGVSITMLLLLTLLLHQHTVLYLVGKWNQLEIGEYGHGYLVLLISAYLVYNNRRTLVALTPCPEYRALLAVLAASMIWTVAALVDIEMLQTVGLLLLVLSLIWVLLGTSVMLALAFPVLYIGFAIPVWFPLSPLLQGLTADAVFWAIRLIEIPALRIENMIVLPAGKLSIEEACSGLRYLLAALTLGTLFAYLNYVTFPARLLVVLISAGAAVLANILRVFIVVYLGYTTEMQHPLVDDHLTLGWYLFAGLIVILLVTDALLHRVRANNSDIVQDVVECAQTQRQCNKGKSSFVVSGLVVFLVVSIGPLMIYSKNTQSSSSNNPVQLKLPLAEGEWTAIIADEDGWTPQYRGAVAYKMTYQNRDKVTVQLYLGVYPTQKQGEELINDLNKISDDKMWRTSYQKAKLIEVSGRQVFEQILEKNNGKQRLVWYWYRVAEHNTVNKYQAKALQVLGLLQGNRGASLSLLRASWMLSLKIHGKYSNGLSPNWVATSTAWLMAGDDTGCTRIKIVFSGI